MLEEKRRIRWMGGQEYIKKVSSVRFFSASVLVAALICAIASGIDRLMMDTGEWITPWMAPHFFDNKFFVTFYGFIVCYLFSDVPFMNRSELYFVLRKGRCVWCMEKVFAIVMQAFSFGALTMFASIFVFLPRVRLETEWGKIIHTMAYSGNLLEYNIIGNPSPVILSKYTPLQAMFVCFLLVGLVSSMIGLLMFAISLYGSRIAAVSVCVILTAFDLAEGMFITSSWLPYVTPFNWCRMGLHGEPVFFDTQYYPSVAFCLGMCGITIIFIIISIMWKSRRMEFVWNQED